MKMLNPLAWLQHGTAATIMLAAAACTGMSSTPVGGDDNYTGVVYSLPTTRIPLVVSVNTSDDQITISAGEPLYISDENHRYHLSLRPSIAHAQIFNIVVGPNGLLTTADLRADGRLDEAIIAAAKSVGAFESEIESNVGQIVYTTSIDVETLASPRDREAPALITLNQKINRALRQRLAAATTSFLKAAAAASQPVSIYVSRDFAAAATPFAAEDCAAGFCYRLPVAYVFETRFYDGTLRRAEFAVPNGSPTYAAAVSRGLFTVWDTKTKLTNGMLASYNQTTEGSELEQLAALPSNVVGGFIEGITQKGRLFDAQSATINSEINLLKAKKELAKPESEGAFSTKPMFSFTAGRPRPKQTGPAATHGSGGMPRGPASGGRELTAPSGPQTGGNPGSGNP